MDATLQKRLIIIVISLLAVGCSDSDGSMENQAPPAAQQADTFPVELSLWDNWWFYRFASNERFDPAKLPADGWTQVILPHTAKIEPRVVTDQWQGDALYRRDFIAPEDWQGKAIWLRFEGAMMVAHVFLNGERIARHQGGYLPFTIDLSDKLRLGQNNRLLVRLDNRDNPVTGPKPLETLDFNYYGGLYREVRLFVRDNLHITDEILANRPAGGGIFVTYPQVSQDRAEILVHTHIANNGKTPRHFTVIHTLMDAGQVVASLTSERMTLEPMADRDHSAVFTVEAPRLWSPRSPALYTLNTRIENESTLIDERDTRIGIRRIKITRDGFSINGEKMFLRGVNRHQEYPYVGYALSPNADYRDAKLIKEAGFDYVRLSHYPHSRHFMRAADELGLVLLNAILGWQYYNPAPAFSEHVMQTCRELVRRDRNHPSVIAWECSLNESPMPPELVDALDRIVHEEYPGDQAYSAGWVPESYDIYLQARQHRLPHPERPIPDKPYIVSEYGDWEYYAQDAGFNQDAWEYLDEAARTSRQLLSDGEVRLLQQATNVQEAHNDNLSTPAFADGYWAMFDYNRGYAEDLEASGLMSLERIAKPAYYFVRSQRDADETSIGYTGGPFVHIASEWRAASPRSVRVYSNGDEVELFLNGGSLGRRTPDRNRISNKLRHPPFTFTTARFVPGTLEAVAYKDGAEVARHSVRTPGEPVNVVAELATQGVEPVDNDLVFVHARIIDHSGVTVPLTGRRIAFSVGNDLEIIGPEFATSENGTAGILVRVKDMGGRFAVSASMK